MRSLPLFPRFHALRNRNRNCGAPLNLTHDSMLRAEKDTVRSRKRGWVMARVIEFYVPQNFKPKRQWVPADQRGKVVEFPRLAVKKSA